MAEGAVCIATDSLLTSCGCDGRLPPRTAFVLNFGTGHVQSTMSQG